MSEVRITVGGRDYTVACGEGEEAHVARLGEMINEKLSQLGNNLSPSETQNLLFGALFVADDLHETRKSADANAQKLQGQVEALEKSGQDASLAAAERDQLRSRVSELETEIEKIQAAGQHSATEIEQLRSEAEKLRLSSQTAASESAALSQQMAELTRERDGLLSKIENKNELLERANDKMHETNQRLEAALVAPAPQTMDTPNADEAALATSLERFADLLEDCANKLEKQNDNP